jgi:L-fucose mutarotase/ribose pyranase (RbsD/FucU family)
MNTARQGDVKSLAKILSTSGEIKTLIQQTKNNLNSIDPQVLSRFEVFLPTTIDPIRLANNLQTMGRNDRIVLSDIKVEGPSSNKKTMNSAISLDSAVKGLVNTVSLGAQIDKAIGIETQNTTTTSGAVDSNKKYVATKATFGFTTTFESFQLFLNDIERSLGLINVTSISFFPAADIVDTKKSKTAPPQNYQFSMTIETYSLQ